jgi:hypothetical protein
MKPPVRLCCGKRHLGSTCGDGLTMCQLCFGRFPLEELHINEKFIRENVCITCAKAELNQKENKQS